MRASFATRPTLARWAPEALIDSLVVLVLGWLDHGDPADDDAFLESAARGMRAMVAAWQ